MEKNENNNKEELVDYNNNDENEEYDEYKEKDSDIKDIENVMKENTFDDDHLSNVGNESTMSEPDLNIKIFNKEPEYKDYKKSNSLDYNENEITFKDSDEVKRANSNQNMKNSIKTKNNIKTSIKKEDSLPNCSNNQNKNERSLNKNIITDDELNQYNSNYKNNDNNVVIDTKKKEVNELNNIKDNTESNTNDKNNDKSNDNNSKGNKCSINADNENTKVTNLIEHIINECGLNYFSLFIFVILSIFFLADGAEMIVISLVVSKLEDIWDLSSTQKGFIGSAVFIGFFTGALLGGKLSDNWGRKPTFILGGSLVLFFGMISAFSPNYGFLVLIRAMFGMGVGISIPPSTSLLAEITPTKFRSTMLTIVWLFFPIGEILAIVIAKWLLPKEDGWRYLLFGIACPSFFCLAISFFLIESPRFLFIKGHYEEACDKLDQILKICGKPILTQEIRDEIRNQGEVDKKKKLILENSIMIHHKKDDKENDLQPFQINIKEEIEKLERLENKKKLEKLNVLELEIQNKRKEMGISHDVSVNVNSNINASLPYTINNHHKSDINEISNHRRFEELENSKHQNYPVTGFINPYLTKRDEQRENEEFEVEEEEEIEVEEENDNNENKIKKKDNNVDPREIQLNLINIKDNNNNNNNHNNKDINHIEMNPKKRIIKKTKKIKKGYEVLFTKKFSYLTFHTSFIFFVCSFVYYGIIYILPQNLDYIIKNSNSTEISSNIENNTSLNTTGTSDSASIVDSDNTDDSDEDEYQKLSHDLDPEVFDDLILSAVSEIPAFFVSMWMSNNPMFGRQRTLYIGYIYVTLISFLCVTFNSHIAVLGAFLKFGINITFNVIYIYVSEAFPTKIRSIAIAFTNAFTRLGGILTPIFMQVLFDCAYWLPYLSYLIFAVIAAFSSFSLPFETLGRKLEDY